jgi:hypothetical protein
MQRLSLQVSPQLFKQNLHDIQTAYPLMQHMQVSQDSPVITLRDLAIQSNMVYHLLPRLALVDPAGHDARKVTFQQVGRASVQTGGRIGDRSESLVGKHEVVRVGAGKGASIPGYEADLHVK